MKPINTHELNKAYLGFVLHFFWLLVIIILVIIGYFVTNRQELQLLSYRARQYDQLRYTREEMTGQFDMILQRMRSLSQYVKADPEEYSNQEVLMNAVEAGTQRIKGALEGQGNGLGGPATELYRKMTGHITLLSTMKDSLAQTRFEIESLRAQLDACGKTNRDAAKDLGGL